MRLLPFLIRSDQAAFRMFCFWILILSPDNQVELITINICGIQSLESFHGSAEGQHGVNA